MKKFIYFNLVLWLVWQWLFSVATPMLQASYPSISQPPDSLYTHQIYRATSVDGLTFTVGNTLLLDHASSPDAVLHGNEVWIYFVNGRLGQEGIWVARQAPSGFEIMEAVKLDGVVAKQAMNPTIISLSDRRYRLFYGDGNTILSAVSEDGLNFSSESEVNIGAASDPTMVQLTNGNWLMAFVRGAEINFATSTTSNVFTPMQTTLSNGGGTPELMALSDGKIRLLVGKDTLKSYLSQDGGQTWQAESPAVSLMNQNKVSAKYPSILAMADGTWSLFYVVVAEPSASTFISGAVQLQGRTNYIGTKIFLGTSDCSSLTADKSTATTDKNGHFEISVTTGQSYQCLQARQVGYLMGQKNLPSGDIGTITLLGGDVNGDNEVNIFDLALIAAGYGSNNPQIDLNGDGLVDIFDLTMTAVNYNKRGPIQ